MKPYKECEDCIATPFCKVYSGAIKPRNGFEQWCRGKYSLDQALRLADIPDNYSEANLFRFQVDDHNVAAYESLKEMVNGIVSDVDQGRNFFVFGSKTGTGKTFFASCLLHAYIYKTCMTERFDYERPLSLFVFYPELIHDLRYRRDDEELERKIDRVKNVPLLLLDDIGAGTMTDFSREQTILILNHRMNKRLSTIVTSNYRASELREEHRLGARIISRLVNKAAGIELGGRDRRLGL
ncbi:ATP-binding protein [Paenibacillus sp. NPDC058071]|uniref:ATP-binding protein n=1 Tax=Paenibacillus sp. NPDC058071 TaxID=3346326 RepID=UPI0036DF7223